MEGILLLPRLHLFILIILNLIVTISLLIQFSAVLWNIVLYIFCNKFSHQRAILNFYLFHHLLVCLIRCLVIFLSCFAILISNYCLSIDIFIHFLLLLSTFDLLLILIGETAHFWDSTVNYKSTLYSKCCLFCGIIFNYFASALFLSIHITMNGQSPILIDFCKINRTNFFFIQSNYHDDKSLIPTMITYVLFILIDLLTCSWIYVSYRDIHNLKRKRLATVFFHSLIFTKFKKYERSTMVNRSLRRLLAISLFVLSNILSTLPLLTITIFHFELKMYQRLIFLYLTTLPWIDCLTFLYYDETKFNGIKVFSKRILSNDCFYRQQRIGGRLSSYRDSIIVI